MTTTTSLQSNYFQLEKVAEGLYAAIVIPGTGPLGNAGIVDLGDRTLIWDTTEIPQAAQDLRRIAEELFARPVSLVVNSHHHLDHVGGNQVFADCDIYATTVIRDTMNIRTRQVLDWCRAHPEFPQQFAEQVEAEPDPVRKQALSIQLSDMRAFEAALPEMQLTLPNVTFDAALTLHGRERTAKLLSYGGGHTPSDLVMYLPEDEVLFIGDLAVVGTHPLIRDGSASEWLTILEKLEELPIRHIISGHGNVTGKDHLQIAHRYVQHIMQTAEELLRTGASVEQVTDLPMPQEYADWRWGDFYHNNIRNWYERLQAEQAEKTTKAGE